MEKKKAKTVKVDIKDSEIVKIVKEAISSCYGVDGLMDKRMINRPDVTKKGKNEDAVFVRRLTVHSFTVDVYLILNSGIKITEALSSTQDSIMYALNKAAPKQCKAVNAYAEMLVSK